MKHIYYAYDEPSIYDLKHFSFPFKFKLNFPKAKTPKMNTKPAKKALSNLKRQSSKVLTGFGSSGPKKGREWKNHKWIARKRDKNGKWIYDYGYGFPGEKKVGETYDLHDLSEMSKTDFKLKRALSFFDLNMPSDIDDTRQVSKGRRFLYTASNLGTALTSLKPLTSLQSGQVAMRDIQISAKKAAAEQSKKSDKIDPKTGLRLKKKATSKDDDLKKTNPSYGLSDGTGNNNCYACTVAYDLRKRGYDVTAAEDYNGANMTTITSLYKNAKPKLVSVKPNPISTKNTSQNYIDNAGLYHNRDLTNELKSELQKEPNGSSGYLTFKWHGSGGGHAVAYEKEKGHVLIYDPQNGQKYELEQYCDKASDVAYFRTDNLEIDYKKAKKVVD